MSNSDNENKIIDDQIEDEQIETTYSITSYGADYPIDSLVQRLDSEDIIIPSFQRQYVWALSQASRFIESLLLGLPVPGIFLSKEFDTQKLLVIDGQQRLKSLQNFYTGLFQGKEFALRNVQKKFEGLTYNKLSPENKRILANSILHATIVRQDAPDDDQSSIYHIFERLNTGGTQLRPQEIRACIYRGEFNDLLNKFAEDKSWKAIYSLPSNRLKDQELILRFFALYYRYNTYDRPLKGFLNTYMSNNRSLKLNPKQELEDLFYISVTFIKEVLGNSAFRRAGSFVVAIFDSVMVGITTRIKKKGKINNLKEFKTRDDQLLSESEYGKNTTGATADQKKVEIRIKLAIEKFKDIP